jgi:hypothetical protein
MSSPACLRCRSWDRLGEQEYGLCRINPPVMIGTAASVDDLGSANPDTGAWPVTMPNDWCGMYVYATGRAVPAEGPV